MTDPIQPGNKSITSGLSYRDPSGFVFEDSGNIYRQVNKNFQVHFDHFIESGFYERLVKTGLLIPHETLQVPCRTREGYLVLKPERIPFISYPYEWSFDMLKDAALLSLRLLRESLTHDMILKDASPYNIQWYKGRLVLIDSLSFEKYDEQRPWIAYRQFCEFFLAPLMLMHYRAHSLQQLLIAWPEGIPLDITSSLLPWRTRWSLHSYLHIHLHAKVSASKSRTANKKIIFSRQKLLNLVTSLEMLLNRLHLKDRDSIWSGYYDEVSARGEYFEHKKRTISSWLLRSEAVKTAIDLGANEGIFSKLMAELNIQTIAADFDPYCINRLYLQVKREGQKNIHPMVIDISNPTPAIGFNNEERLSFLDRLQADQLWADILLAVGLVHHLAIGKNIPLPQIASLFSKMSKILIIEFIPKDDIKVKEMLAQKKDIYIHYDEAKFESAFREYFSILNKELIPGSNRVLYYMSVL